MPKNKLEQLKKIMGITNQPTKQELEALVKELQKSLQEAQPKDQLTRMNEILAILDQPTKKDLKDLVEILIKAVQQAQKNLETSAKTTVKDGMARLENAIASLKATEARISNVQGIAGEVSNKATTALRSEIRAELERVRGEMPEMPRPFDPKYLEKQLLDAERKSVNFITMGELKTALDPIYEEIKKLREDLLERMSRIPRGGMGGGGVSAIGVRQAFKYIAHTEEPVGDIDGVNATYTVKNDIFWIAGFLLSGEPIAELPNFTYAGKTITFTTALPAAYSGKDFEIKYIG